MALGFVLWTRRAMRWGARSEELARVSTGVAWMPEAAGSRFRMTRAISIEASPETVWLWLARNGRGAGWFSWDRLDNGGRASARHIVSWIPEPAVGDAAAIGYLRHLEPGREIVWWAPDLPFLGARTWSAWQYTLSREGAGSRLLMRVDVLAAGSGRWMVMVALPLIDSFMAVRQLCVLKQRAEERGGQSEDPERLETGERDQFQLHHVIYASGDEAGVPGVENARRSRQRALEDGVLGA